MCHSKRQEFAAISRVTTVCQSQVLINQVAMELNFQFVKNHGWSKIFLRHLKRPTPPQLHHLVMM